MGKRNPHLTILSILCDNIPWSVAFVWPRTDSKQKTGFGTGPRACLGPKVPPHRHCKGLHEVRSLNLFNYADKSSLTRSNFYFSLQKAWLSHTDLEVLARFV